LEGIATSLPANLAGIQALKLKSLTWFGRDCDTDLFSYRYTSTNRIEVVDLVWKGLRQSETVTDTSVNGGIEVVDLVWKGLRQGEGRGDDVVVR